MLAAKDCSFQDVSTALSLPTTCFVLESHASQVSTFLEGACRQGMEKTLFNFLNIYLCVHGLLAAVKKKQ